MFSETILQQATETLTQIGFVDRHHILSDEIRRKDFLLQIATMILYQVEITPLLVNRILSVIEVTNYTKE